MAMPQSRETVRGARSARTSCRFLVVVAIVAATGVWLAACAEAPTSRSAAAGTAPLRVRLSAGVAAAPGAVVDAQVTFTPSGSSSVIIVARDSIVVSTGEANQSLALVGDVGPCVTLAPIGNPCQLDLSVRLTRNGSLLDEQRQRLSVSEKVDQVTAEPVQLYEVASIRISPSPVTGVQTADTLVLSATPLDRSGTTVAARTATWSTVSGSASVSIGDNGVLRALQPGNATVRATIGGRTQELSITVLPPLTVTVTPSAAASDVLIDANIRLTFSETVNASSVTAATIALTRNGIVVPATRAANGRVVTVTPTAPMLEFQNSYVVTVNSGLTSTLGTRLLSTLTSSFVTTFWDPNYSYRLTNSAAGTGRSLDLNINAFCIMANSGSTPGQSWFFVPIANAGGFFTMHTEVAGATAALEGAVAPTPCFMTNTNVLFTGMHWRAAPAPPSAPGAYYLYNLNFGVNRALDILGTAPQMNPTANTSTQFWTFTRLSRRSGT